MSSPTTHAGDAQLLSQSTMSRHANFTDLPLDLLLQIFYLLSPHTKCPSQYPNIKPLARSLARCARVCRTLRDPALKVLWEHSELLHVLRVVWNFGSGSGHLGRAGSHSVNAGSEVASIKADGRIHRSRTDVSVNYA